MIRNEAELVAEFIRTLAPVPDSELNHLFNLLKPLTIRRGMLFCEVDMPTRTLAFVIQGIFKVYYLTHDGRPFIRIFHSEGSPLADYGALLKGGVAEVTIEAIEDSKVVQIQYSDFVALYERHPSWQELGRKVAEEFMLIREKRERQLLTLDARGRYEEYLEEHRSNLNRIAQQDVASYIGITPVSLSRLAAARVREKRQ